MATLGNYLSGRGSRTMKTAGSSHFPVIKRYNPYTPNQSRALNPTPISAPYSNQDLAAALLQQQQNRQATTPSSTFQDTYNYDPIQTKIQALGAQSVANAQTNASQLRKEAAINEGDPDLLKSLGFDQNTINAASGNPQSLYTQLNTDYSNRQNQLANSMQAQNLYYSGENQKQLGLQSQGLASAQANLGQKLRDLLSGADTGVLASQEADRQATLQQGLDAAAQTKISDLYSQLLAAMNGTVDPSADPTGGAGLISGPDAGIFGSTQPYTIGGPGQVLAPVPFGGTPTPTLPRRRLF